MAEALVRGLLAAGRHAPRALCVAEPLAERRRALDRRFGISTSDSNTTVASSAAVVILAVKPQIMDAVLAEIRPVVKTRTLFVSIAAGVPLQRLQRGLGSTARIVRVMPNTPALLGRGISVLVGSRRTSARDVERVRRIFAAVGEAIAVRKEALLDPVTGLSGSGPAFVYAFAEALIDGGAAAGLPRDLAVRLALGTVAGAAAMMLETGKSPAELRAMVTSPRGTTLAGLEYLRAHHFGRTVAGSVRAATARARALARG